MRFELVGPVEEENPEGYPEDDACLYERKLYVPKVVIDEEHPQEGLFPANYDEYMQYWPADIPLPVSIVVLGNQWRQESTYNHYYGVTEYEWEGYPTTVLTMPNGATLTYTEMDPFRDEEPEATWEGDWSVYAAPSSEELNCIIDVVDEAYSLSDETPESILEMRSQQIAYSKSLGFDRFADNE